MVRIAMARKSNGTASPQVVTDLVERMLASGRTRIDIARSAGISERQIYYLMSGHNKSVGADVLCALAAQVDCQVVLRKAPRPSKP